MKELWAHTPTASNSSPHLLEDHLRSVAALTESFASKFSSGSAGYSVGLAHDIAKAAPAFQTYLRAPKEIQAAITCPHALPGAAAMGAKWHVVANIVAGHHRGLYDTDELKQKFAEVDREVARAALEAWVMVAGEEGTPSLPDWVMSAPEALELWTRMLFSCLIDADRLDTEQFANGVDRTSAERYPPLSDYEQALTRRLNAFPQRDDVVSRVRREVLEACRAAATAEPGVFRLTVPTGGGKTLSGLAFALKHAVAHGLDRVIFAIPYTSIIEQTAEVYRGIFGAENVIEHHSNAGIEEREDLSDETERRRRWATENWDAPLVVTTTVQLFESLLNHRPKRCRKLHNIANSVIVIDEVQTLPVRHLTPILDVLSQLTTHYGCTVVLCTATQPDYEAVDSRVSASSREIVPNYPEHFTAMKRVSYEFRSEPWTAEDAARVIGTERQALLIVNTKRAAREIASALESDEAVFHLSTRMCGAHRREALAEVRRRLAEGLPVRLVSTQLIEAGVDVDFPVVYRALGPLDSVIQAAGRCNREGVREMGRCVVFPMVEAVTPKGSYRTATQVTEDLCVQQNGQPDDPEVSQAFWRRLYASTDIGVSAIQPLRRELKFETVGKTFRMIEDDQEAVLAVQFAPEAVRAWQEEWPAANGRKWMRKAQQWTVNLRPRELAHARAMGWIEDHVSGLLLYLGPYSSSFGIRLDAPDIESLIR